MAASGVGAGDDEDGTLLFVPWLLLSTEPKHEDHDTNAVKLDDDVPFFFPPPIASN